MPWRAVETQRGHLDSPHSCRNWVPQEVNIKVKEMTSKGRVLGKWVHLCGRQGEGTEEKGLLEEVAPRHRRLAEWWARRDSRRLRQLWVAEPSPCSLLGGRGCRCSWGQGDTVHQEGGRTGGSSISGSRVWGPSPENFFSALCS